MIHVRAGELRAVRSDSDGADTARTGGRKGKTLTNGLTQPPHSFTVTELLDCLQDLLAVTPPANCTVALNLARPPPWLEFVATPPQKTLPRRAAGLMLRFP